MSDANLDVGLLIMDRLLKTLKDLGADVRIESYSGRGMFGKRCLSIKGSQKDIDELLSLTIIQYVDDAKDTILDEAEGGKDMLDNVSYLTETFIKDRTQDTLGYDVVVYFRNLIWTDALQKQIFEADM